MVAPGTADKEEWWRKCRHSLWLNLLCPVSVTLRFLAQVDLSHQAGCLLWVSIIPIKGVLFQPFTTEMPSTAMLKSTAILSCSLQLPEAEMSRLLRYRLLLGHCSKPGPPPPKSGARADLALLSYSLGSSAAVEGSSLTERPYLKTALVQQTEHRTG